MKLMRQPSQPSHHPVLTLKLGNPKYESWKSFLPKSGGLVEVG
jgi:hypothetical protein